MAWSSIDQVVSPLSGIRNVDSLISQDHLTYNYELPLENSIAFTFDISANVAAPSTLSLQSMNETQQNTVRQALGYITTVTGISFTEDPASGDNDLVFGYYSAKPNNAGVDYSVWNETKDASGMLVTLDLSDTVLLNSNNADQVNPVPGTDGYATILHEIGHALGLKHPFDDSPTLTTFLDNESWTVMSYTPSPTGEHPVTYGPIDIAALNWLYGGDGLRNQYGLTVNAQNAPGVAPAPNFATLSAVGGVAAKTLADASGDAAFSLTGDPALLANAWTDQATGLSSGDARLPGLSPEKGQTVFLAQA